MIAIKNEHELESMRQACKITAAARALAGEMVRPGVSTKEIDKAVYDFIVAQGAKPSFLNYNGFPASTCISVNATVIHGIPGGYTLKEGDIVSVDVGAFYKGFHGDCAATFPCGKISAEAQKLIDVTRQSFFEGIRFATKGHRVSDISHAIQTYVEDSVITQDTCVILFHCYAWFHSQFNTKLTLFLNEFGIIRRPIFV